MKFTSKIIAVLTFAVILFASSNATAQTDEQTAEEKAEKQEVQKFVESFLQSLDETKDLDKVPEKFFVADFKIRLAQNEHFNNNDEFFIQLIEGERYEYNVSVFNLLHLQMMYFAGNSKFKADKDCDECEIRDIYAPNAFKILKRSAGLRDLIDVGSDDFKSDDISDVEIQNFVEFQDAFNDLKLITEAQRKYLNARSPKWKEKYTRNIAKARKKIFEDEDFSYKADFCKEEECEGLPEKTHIFYSGVIAPLAFKIVKENGELKILNLLTFGD